MGGRKEKRLLIRPANEFVFKFFSTMCSSNVNSLSMMMLKSIFWKTRLNATSFRKYSWACLMLFNFHRVKAWPNVWPIFQPFYIIPEIGDHQQDFFYGSCSFGIPLRMEISWIGIWQFVDINNECKWSETLSWGIPLFKPSWFRFSTLTDW